MLHAPFVWAWIASNGNLVFKFYFHRICSCLCFASVGVYCSWIWLKSCVGHVIKCHQLNQPMKETSRFAGHQFLTIGVHLQLSIQHQLAAGTSWVTQKSWKNKENESLKLETSPSPRKDAVMTDSETKCWPQFESHLVSCWKFWWRQQMTNHFRNIETSRNIQSIYLVSTMMRWRL